MLKGGQYRPEEIIPTSLPLVMYDNPNHNLTALNISQRVLLAPFNTTDANVSPEPTAFFANLSEEDNQFHDDPDERTDLEGEAEEQKNNFFEELQGKCDALDDAAQYADDNTDQMDFLNNGRKHRRISEIPFRYLRRHSFPKTTFT